MTSCQIQESKKKARYKLHVLGMNNDLWEKVRG